MLLSDVGEIIAGHGWGEAAMSPGLKTVSTLALAHLSDTERRAYVVTVKLTRLRAGRSECGPSNLGPP